MHGRGPVIRCFVSAAIATLLFLQANTVFAANPNDISVYPDPFLTFGPKSNFDYSGDWTPYCSPGATNYIRWYTANDILQSAQPGFDCALGTAIGPSSTVPGSILLWNYGAGLLPSSLPHSPLQQFFGGNGSFYFTLTSNFSNYSTSTTNPAGISILTDPVWSEDYSPYSNGDLTTGWQPYCTPGGTNTVRWYTSDGTLRSMQIGLDCAIGMSNSTGTVPGAVNVWNFGGNILPASLPHNTGNFFGPEGDFYFTLTNGDGAVYRYDYGWHTTTKVNRFDWAWDGSDYVFPNSIPLQTATVTAPVIIIPGIVGSAKHNDEWVIDPITHGFDNLIETLVVNGYKKETDLFTFPYDWHKSNVDTAILLKQKIDAVKSICQCDKIDLVAHSMGGLVARQYIQSDGYENDVRNMIFLGTPHLGAPLAYLMWEGGEMDTDFQSKVNRAYLQFEAFQNHKLSLFDYIRETPITSVQELLPVYDYIKHVGVANIAPYPNSNWYPTNSFLEQLNSAVQNLYDSNVTIANFVGERTGDKTISIIRVIPNATSSPLEKWGYGYPEGFPKNGDAGLERGAGDEIVPIESSSFINQGVQKTFDANHGNLITDSEAYIFEQLTNKDAVKLIHKTYGSLDSITSLIMLRIHSPADIMVVSPDGKRVGKDFTTGQEFNEVPDAFYSGFQTEDEYITIPNPINGEYKFIAQGTGVGKYTLITDTISEATSSETSFVGQTLPGLITEHVVNIDTANPGETLITPTDLLPPTITFIQPATTTYTHSDLLPINITFLDSTGIASSSVSFDNKAVAASSTVDLFYETLSTHTITASSSDLVNNATTSRKILRVIATASSTISDIQREYTLGWIKSKDLRDLLVKKLNASVKLQKITDTIVVSTKPLVTKKVDRWVEILDTLILKSMLIDLSLAKNLKLITDQGYQILVADINWLLSH